MFDYDFASKRAGKILMGLKSDATKRTDEPREQTTIFF
jgi:hypothetical protein